MISGNNDGIKIMSVREACSELDSFIQMLSSKVNPLPIDNDIQHKLSQISITLCEIEAQQIILTNKSTNEIDADSLLANMRNKRDKVSNDLYMSLMKLIQSQNISDIHHPKSGKNLDELLYEIALTLANLNPINTYDFATQEPIAPEKLIVTSDRYQHDIDSLQVWLRHKTTNPWTNLKFSERDINFIRLNLQIRKPTDAIDINEGNPYPGGDPDLAATITLARRLEVPTHNNGTRHELHRLSFFRRNYEPDNVMAALALVEGFYRLSSGYPERPAEHYEVYTGIPVTDIPSFRQITQPSFWPTHSSQTESDAADESRRETMRGIRAMFSPRNSP